MKNPEQFDILGDVISEAQYDLITRQFRDQNFCFKLINSTRQKLILNQEIREYFNVVCTFIEPVDPVLGTEPGFPVAWSFFNGCSFGVGIANIMYPKFRIKDLESAIGDMPVNTNWAEEELSNRYNTGDFFINEGLFALSKYKRLNEIVEKSEDRANPDVRTLNAYKSGCGYGFSVARKALNIAQTMEIESGLRVTDWDHELKRIT
jgi:hypothetical protein